MEAVYLIKCPTCRRNCRFSDANVYRPFCSERCRLEDTAAWATETYRVPGEPVFEVPSDADGSHESERENEF